LTLTKLYKLITWGNTLENTLEKRPLTLNEFQQQTINQSSLTKESASIDLVYQSSKIFTIIEELSNESAQITPTGFGNIQTCLSNALRDICILANNFGYSLNFLKGKIGKERLDGFAYTNQYELDRKKYEEQYKNRDKKARDEIAVMPEKKKKETTCNVDKKALSW